MKYNPYSKNEQFEDDSSDEDSLLTLPEFLFAEFPIKTGGVGDFRTFIVYYGSILIEVFSMNLYGKIDFNDEVIQKSFNYLPTKDTYVLAFHYDTIEQFDKSSSIEVLDKAWVWYENYLNWEKQQLVQQLKEEYGDDPDNIPDGNSDNLSLN